MNNPFDPGHIQEEKAEREARRLKLRTNLLIALFCGVVNCPLASIFLAIELFGGEGLLFFALACALSFLVSGRYSLYSSQNIVYSKLEARLYQP